MKPPTDAEVAQVIAALEPAPNPLWTRVMLIESRLLPTPKEAALIAMLTIREGWNHELIGRVLAEKSRLRNEGGQ